MTLVSATQVMQRPSNYKDAPHKYPQGQSVPRIIHKRSGAKANIGYFTNWGIYGANFQPTDINPGPLTHILYAFADVSPDTGNITLTDSYADEQKHFPGDSWDEPGNNLYGCLKQMFLLKMAHRNLKVSLSVGGWTYSQDGHFSFVTDATKRQTFVESALQLMEDYGFDGLDLDFEYPSSTAQGQGFADLITSLRSAFDTYQAQKGDATPYLLTSAVSAGAANYEYLIVPQIDQALTYWNLMAYDYAGSWLTWADNQANLYDGARTNVSTDAAIKWYLSQGATAGKIVMGIPLYGRAFEDTTGLGAPYNGIGPGTISPGIYSYSDLPLAGAQVYENLTDVSSYSYDPVKMELVSYDTPTIASIKAQYVNTNNLAGNMFWDLSTDKTGTPDSLVSTTANVFGVLDQTLNHLDYPNSKWDNIRNQMGTAPGSSPTSSSTAPTTTPTGGSGSGQCAGVAAWSSSTAYNGGQAAVYGSHLWTAKWWTQGDTPGGSAGVWTDDGAC
ncbi:glycoside hydrolase family 18 protein [Phanerochaete carnosa HHB-10118-sp]|uniref:Glycoside hydrolase family 18 protein n=1 Tax=Phanerochaete carnosa (strain HHB-10118-sp) TaxID=650164 RepID=K5W349_PHACS|nr:glycoside hydrolase family 18 protein [Phanerochaete carnosa HHB-10118-sp]EKM53324.1 glycoside hydrolase family 18 protein [Phanerochaete carnosa HHB-10118-sp]